MEGRGDRVERVKRDSGTLVSAVSNRDNIVLARVIIVIALESLQRAC